MTDATGHPTPTPTPTPPAGQDDAATDTHPIPPVHTATPDAPSPRPQRRLRPLFPTILWGALMLALAAFIAARELVPGGFDLVTWLLAAVVGIGLLLVVAGIAAASRRAG